MKRALRYRDRAMTLVEVLVTGALLGLVVGFVGSAYANANRAFTRLNDSSSGFQAAMVELEEMSREIRISRSVAPISEPTLDRWKVLSYIYQPDSSGDLVRVQYQLAIRTDDGGFKSWDGVTPFTEEVPGILIRQTMPVDEAELTAMRGGDRSVLPLGHSGRGYTEQVSCLNVDSLDFSILSGETVGGVELTFSPMLTTSLKVDDAEELVIQTRIGM